jgi:hypothetical protein
MRILIVKVDVPFPPMGGGLMRTHQLLRALAGAHDLTLVAFTYHKEYQKPPFPIRV